MVARAAPGIARAPVADGEASRYASRMALPSAAPVYDKPLIYDIAFSYRDFRNEVDCLAAETGVSWEDAARHWYGVSGWIDFPWLLARIAEADGDDAWEHRAARGLAEDVTRARRRLVQRLCAAGASTTGPDAPGVPRARAAKVASLIADIKATPRVSSVALHVVVRELVHMCGAREEDA